MLFSINKNILLENLNHVQKAISSKSPIPILGGIKISVSDNKIILVASNADLSITSMIENEDSLNITTVGSIVLQSRILVDIVRKIDSKIITFSQIDGNLIRITSNHSVFDLNGFDATEYPLIDFSLSDNFITFSKQIFKKNINETSFAVATAEGHPILTGVNFNFIGNKLEILATDSFRLAKKEMNLNNEDSKFLNFVIAGRNLNNLIKMLDDDGDLEIYFYINKVIFKFNNVLYQTKLLDGKYPDVTRLLQDDFSKQIEISLHELFSSIDRASLLTSDRSKNIVKLEMKNNKLTITSTTPEIGKVVENLEYLNANFEEITIAFSARYVSDALRAIESENVTLCFSGDVRPFIITNKEDNTSTHLILPVKTY